MISVEEFDITLLPHSIYFCIFYTVIHFQGVNSMQRKLFVNTSQCGIGKCKRSFRTEFNCTLFYAVPPSLDLSFSLSLVLLKAQWTFGRVFFSIGIQLARSLVLTAKLFQIPPFGLRTFQELFRSHCSVNGYCDQI